MKKFEGILICTDLDGTLLRNDSTVSSENLDAIGYFKSEGGIFTFITGRMPFFAGEFYDIVKPNAPIGCINGGGIYDYVTQKYLWTKPLDPSAIELAKYAEEQIPELGYQINTFDQIYFCRENETMERFRRVTRMPNLTCSCDAIKEPIAKIVFGDQKEENIRCLKELLDAHPRAAEFDFIRSERTLYEILPKGSGKGAVLPKLAEVLKLDLARTIAIGDYNNDISMLRAAGCGIAVANARPEVKAVADHVTVSNEEHAIAKIIGAIESGALPFN